jgi:hypothetical protein
MLKGSPLEQGLLRVPVLEVALVKRTKPKKKNFKTILKAKAIS